MYRYIYRAGPRGGREQDPLRPRRVPGVQGRGDIITIICITIICIISYSTSY